MALVARVDHGGTRRPCANSAVLSGGIVAAGLADSSHGSQVFPAWDIFMEKSMSHWNGERGGERERAWNG